MKWPLLRGREGSRTQNETLADAEKNPLSHDPVMEPSILNGRKEAATVPMVKLAEYRG